MTGSGQSQEEATAMIMGRQRQNNYTGFWNVRTMYEQGKMAQVIAEMNRNKLDILGIKESRWTRSGRMKTSTGKTILYSEREDDHDLHHEGVAIIFS